MEYGVLLFAQHLPRSVEPVVEKRRVQHDRALYFLCIPFSLLLFTYILCYFGGFRCFEYSDSGHGTRTKKEIGMKSIIYSDPGAGNGKAAMTLMLSVLYISVHVCTRLARLCMGGAGVAEEILRLLFWVYLCYFLAVSEYCYVFVENGRHHCKLLLFSELHLSV